VNRSTLAVQVGMLARRSVVRTLRQPLMVVPSLFFPLLLLSINSSGLDSATRLPGFCSFNFHPRSMPISTPQESAVAIESACQYQVAFNAGVRN